MAKKTFTFLITSNRKGKTQSLTISSSLLQLVLASLLVVGVVIVSMAVDYVGLLLEAGENKRLVAENTRLKKQFDVIEGKVNALEASLGRVKSFSTKLKLITDIDSEDRNVNVALGPDAIKNLSSGRGSQREVAGIQNDNFDKVFFSDIETNDSKNEVIKLDTRNYATLSVRLDEATKNSKLEEQGVIELYKKLSERQSLVKSTPSIKPVKGWYTSKFGYRDDPFSGKPVMHNGLDIAAPEGASVVAPADGVVAHVGYEDNLGKVLTIDHGYGIKTRFAHNSQIFVEIGQKVTKKEVVAAVGNTGRSQGPHVYYEVRLHGIPVDPLTYILE